MDKALPMQVLEVLKRPRVCILRVEILSLRLSAKAVMVHQVPPAVKVAAAGMAVHLEHAPMVVVQEEAVMY